MKIVYSICFCFLSSLVFAQNLTETFEANNFNWKQNTSGLLFYDIDNGLPGMEIPAGEGNSPVFSAAFWAGGLASDSSVHVAAQYYCQNEGENCTESWGPLKIGTAETTLAVAEDYNRFWFVTRDQIDAHIAYYDCLSDPDCDTETQFPGGYTPPEAILSWPANGPEAPGYSEHLAPFVDYNGDGEYTPEMGDYPNICGDFSTYLITNDVGTENASPLFESIGIEVHTKVYGYYASSGALFNTLFVQHKVINRSSATYNDMYFGTFTDFDLGNPLDDYIATDVKRSMYLVQNGDAFDESSSSGPGYGEDLPMMGVRYLGGPFQNENDEDDSPLYASYDRYADQGSGWNDGIVDNERFGLSSDFHFLSSGVVGQPLISLEKYRALQGLWRDGTPITFGGNGYNPEGGITTTYQYPGLSDPLLAGTNGIDPEYDAEEGWTESYAGNPLGDRRMIAGSGSFTFAPGDVQYLDYAFVFARQSMAPATDLREILNNYADEIVGMECTILPDISTGVEEQNRLDFSFELYPNPASETVTIRYKPVRNGQYSIYDLPGKLVANGKLNPTKTTISLGELKSGVYILQIDTESASGVKRIVIN